MSFHNSSAKQLATPAAPQAVLAAQVTAPEEEPVSTPSETLVEQEESIVRVKENPAGFLRLRETPGGVEVIKLTLGEKLTLVQEEKGWSQIKRENGTSGWVVSTYIEKLEEQTL